MAYMEVGCESERHGIKVIRLPGGLSPLTAVRTYSTTCHYTLDSFVVEFSTVLSYLRSFVIVERAVAILPFPTRRGAG
jgi:hypothetical protein